MSLLESDKRSTEGFYKPKPCKREKMLYIYPIVMIMCNVALIGIFISNLYIIIISTTQTRNIPQLIDNIKKEQELHEFSHEQILTIKRDLSILFNKTQEKNDRVAIQLFTFSNYLKEHQDKMQSSFSSSHCSNIRKLAVDVKDTLSENIEEAALSINNNITETVQNLIDTIRNEISSNLEMCSEKCKNSSQTYEC